MIALVDEPLVREAFFPSAVQHYAIETARADDGPAIEAITARHESEDEVARMRAWWDAVPSAFRVARSPRGEVVAFTILCEFSTTCRGGCWPTTRCASPGGRHLRAQPVAAGERDPARAPDPRLGHRLRVVAVLRGAAARPRARVAGGRPERCGASTPRRAVAAMREQLAPIGFVELGRSATVFGYRPILLDLGPESAVSWLSDARRPRPRPARRPASTTPRASCASTATGSRSPSSSAT